MSGPPKPGSGRRLDQAEPEGLLTFLFTDVAGSTRGWERDHDAYGAAIQRHFDILHAAVESGGGRVFKTVGDQVCAVFGSPSGAVAAAIEAQRGLIGERWPAPVGDIRVRMALHRGDPVRRGGDFFGPPVNRVARLLGAAHPGQILLSDALRTALPDAVETKPLGVHMLKDLQHPEALFQVMAPGLPARFPPPLTLDARPHNLPPQLTSFVGRDREMAELATRFEDPATRLVTLMGPPGVGKTRLATQFAAEYAYRFPDGVWLVELAAVREPGAVAAQVAAALGLSQDGGRSAAERLVDALARRRLLLVLDNFEHVLSAADGLSALLRATRDVRALVTSRSMLRVRGETVVEVAPLNAPEPSPALTVPDLERCPATALFLDRAAAARPDWEPGEADEIAALCQELDGLPLAIELAAARMRSMTPRDIRARLSDRFRLLSAGSVDLPERQRTLRAALDWSYGLLRPEEQQTLAQLGVFRGRFSLEAAEAVCDGAAGDLWDTLPALHDQSFLVARERGGVMRYGMLEAVREYAREQLGGGLPERQAAHAAYFLPLAEAAAQALDTVDDAAASDRLEADMDNIREAMTWACRSGDAEPCARFAVATSEFFHRQGWWTERLEGLDAALAGARPALGEAPVVAWLLYHHANALADLGRIDEARVSADDSLRRARSLGDTRLEAWDLNLLGFLEERGGDAARAEELYRETLEMAERHGDIFSMASALTNRGRLADYAGDVELAEECYARSLPLWREVGSARGLATTLANLGCLADEVRGRLAEDAGRMDEAHTRRVEAIGLFGEALNHQIRLRNRPKVALLLNNIGEALARDGRPEEALPLFVAAERIFQQAGSPRAEYVAAQRERARAGLSEEAARTLEAEAAQRDPLDVAREAAGMSPAAS